MSGSMVALPTTADTTEWSADQKALLDFAGLVVRKRNQDPVPAPSSTVMAFLQQCDRTGLDPIARQIYAIERGGKWTIQVSIDGMRLVAQRSGKYRGQSAPQWTDGSLVKSPMRDLDGSIIRDADGSIVWTEDFRWLDVWTGPGYPVAARLSVYRSDFPEPLTAIARWESYKVEHDEWRNGSKTGNKILGDTWSKMPDLMLAKVAEALALRKAFPMDLSGLYTEEEMDGQHLGDQEQGPSRQPRTISTVASRARAAAAAQAETPAEPADASTDAVQPEAAGSDEVTLNTCARCGQLEEIEPGAICASCEAEVEAEIAAQNGEGS